jgi:hypothetical protein
MEYRFPTENLTRLISRNITQKPNILNKIKKSVLLQKQNIFPRQESLFSNKP